jgi:hypothetical protein
MYMPAAHGLHDVDDDLAPVAVPAVKYLPAAHVPSSLQAFSPFSSEYFAAAQGAHWLAAPAEAVPSQHVLHPSLSCVRFSRLLPHPSAQVMGLHAAPVAVSWNMPATQSAQPDVSAVEAPE